MTLHLKIALAQINPIVGNLRYNSDKIVEHWQRADECDLVVFSELALCGYPPEDLILKPFFIKQCENALADLLSRTADFKAAALIGAPVLHEEKIYNAAHLIEGGKIIATIFKHHLPNYGVFDEQRIFTRGPLPAPVEFRGHKLGIMICEDMWYADVAAHLKNQDAEIFIVPNGSPFEADKEDARMNFAKARVTENSLPLVYVNQVGGQDELIFDGGSFVMNKDGEITGEAPYFQESLLLCHSDRAERLEESSQQTSGEDPSTNARDDNEVIYKALVLGLKDYVQKNNFPGVLIGMSGGIDSALSAAIAADALGPEHVTCVMMPSQFTSDDSLEDARSCADALGVNYDTIPIDQPMSAFTTIIPGLEGIAHENIQPRIRATILMGLSNKSGLMLLSTGNKSEMAVGYATLYGDMCGGFNALKDLYKTQVYALSNWRNTQGPSPVIPERIITKAPTAELKDNQTDQDTLPEYADLDDILSCLIEHDMGIEEIVKRGHDKDTVARVWKMLDRAEYKRRQAPPGIKITSRAFGRDRRYPITNRFRDRS